MINVYTIFEAFFILCLISFLYLGNVFNKASILLALTDPTLYKNEPKMVEIKIIKITILKKIGIIYNYNH